MKEDVKIFFLWIRNSRLARGVCLRSCLRLLVGEWRGGIVFGFDVFSVFVLFFSFVFFVLLFLWFCRDFCGWEIVIDITVMYRIFLYKWEFKGYVLLRLYRGVEMVVGM